MRVAGRAAVEAASGAGAFTIGWGPVSVAVAMTKAVTHTMPIAVVRAGERANFQASNWHALLINTQTVIATSCAFWC